MLLKFLGVVGRWMRPRRRIASTLAQVEATEDHTIASIIEIAAAAIRLDRVYNSLPEPNRGCVEATWREHQIAQIASDFKVDDVTVRQRWQPGVRDVRMIVRGSTDVDAAAG